MPYIIMVLVIGLPVFFAELFVGQYSGIGPIKAYARLAPFFQGIYYIYIYILICNLYDHSTHCTRSITINPVFTHI